MRSVVSDDYIFSAVRTTTDPRRSGASWSDSWQRSARSSGGIASGSVNGDGIIHRQLITERTELSSNILRQVITLFTAAVLCWIGDHRWFTRKFLQIWLGEWKCLRSEVKMLSMYDYLSSSRMSTQALSCIWIAWNGFHSIVCSTSWKDWLWCCISSYFVIYELESIGLILTLLFSVR